MQFADLQKLYARYREETEEALLRAAASGRYIGGEEVETFARELGEWMGVRHVVPVANGTDALQVALMAAGLQRGDEVIVPSFTYVASAEAVALLGLVPVFADVDERTFCLTRRAAEAALTPRTRALLPVHLFGRAAPMEELRALAREEGLFVIEDNAQAMGATYLSKSAGTFSEKCSTFPEKRQHFSAAAPHEVKTGTESPLSCTSFFPTKNLACLGDGGAITTDDDALAGRALRIARHGQAARYRHECLGCNSRLDALQAAVLRVRLRHLDEMLRRRRAVALRYGAELAGLPGICLPEGASEAPGHTYNQYTLRVDGGAARRDALAAYLRERGVPTMVYYPLPLHRQPAYERYAPQHPLPVSERLCGEVLSLPVHSELAGEEQDCVIRALREWRG